MFNLVEVFTLDVEQMNCEVKIPVKYIIADPEDQSRCQLKNSLDSYELLAFQGSFTTYEDATNSIHGKPPDIAFIRMGKAALDPFRLACELREQNPLIKVIFMSSHKEDAVEAFEYGADGFVLIPFVIKYFDLYRSLDTAEHEV